MKAGSYFWMTDVNDVRVINANELANAGILQVTEGIKLAEKIQNPNSAVFDDGAVFPTNNWRQPSEEELAEIHLPNVVDVNIPQIIYQSGNIDRLFDINLLKSIQIERDKLAISHNIPTVAAIVTSAAENIFSDIICCDAAFLGSSPQKIYLERVGPFRLGVNNPGLPTTTLNWVGGGKILGLHIDTTSSGTPRERDKAAWLWNVNLGVNPRAFIFVPKTYKKLISALSQRKNNLDHSYLKKESDIARCFLNIFSKTLIWRLLLYPKFGYIAPVDNIIHDGSSNISDTIDIFICARGFIKL